jgi:hypothetical protein
MILTSARLTAVAVLALIGSPQALAQELDLAGRYNCEGVNPGGTRYRALVQIDKDGQTYVVRWVSRQPAVGIGIVHGDQLSVAYTSPKGGIGVIVYRIEKGLRLTGRWTLLGADGQLYGETLTRIGLTAKNPYEDNDPVGSVTLADTSRPHLTTGHTDDERLIPSSGSTP